MKVFHRPTRKRGGKSNSDLFIMQIIDLQTSSCFERDLQVLFISKGDIFVTVKLPKLEIKSFDGVEAVAQRRSVKKVSLKISQNSHENTCARVSFLIKLQARNFIKVDTLAQVLSREFCEIFKKNLFYRTPLGDCFYTIKTLIYNNTFGGCFWW